MSDLLTRAHQVVADAVDDAREELVALCRALVEAPSVNPPGDTRAVASVVAAYFADHGIPIEVVATDELKPNLVATVGEGDPGRHLVFNGHLDTMVVSREHAWTVPVFEMTRKDGMLFGLGMGNMKAGVAALCTAFRICHEHPELRRGPISLVLVSDEIFLGDNGAEAILRDRPGLRGDGLVSAEGPGFGRLAIAEKGIAWYALTARTEGGHTSTVRRGVNATARLAGAICEIDAWNGQVFDPPGGLTADHDTPGMTMVANTASVSAGTVVGQVAEEATCQLDLRLPPGIRLQEIDEQIASVAERFRLEHRRLTGWDASWTSADEPLVQIIADVIEQVSGAAPETTIRIPGSDATRWRARGVPAICYGPQPTLSAGVDDHVHEDDVVKCAKVYALTAVGFGSNR